MRNQRTFARSPIRTIPLLGLLAACLLPAAAFAAAPVAPRDVVGVSIGTDLQLDTSFGDAGYTVVNYNDADGIWDEAVRTSAADDGGYWLMGFHRASGNDARFAVSKIDADGRIDTAFGNDGKLLAPTDINQINDAIVVDGRFYVTGIHYGDIWGVVAVACLESDGTPCAGFGDAGNVQVSASAIGNSEGDRLLYRDGALYVVGNAAGQGEFGPEGAIGLVKLDAATGALDADFGNGSGALPGTAIIDPNLTPDAWDFARTAAFTANGHLLVGGSAYGQSGNVGFVASVDPASGTLDTDFGSSGYACFTFDLGVNFTDVTVRALLPRDDGRILVAGDVSYDDANFNTPTEVLMASLEADGSPTAGFGDGSGVGHTLVGQLTNVTDMVARANGDLVVSMASNGLLPNDYTSDGLQSIVQFDASGNGPTATISIEFPSQTTPNGRPVSMLVDAQDRIAVAGFRQWDFVFPNPDSDHTLLRLVRADGLFADGFDPTAD